MDILKNGSQHHGHHLVLGSVLLVSLLVPRWTQNFQIRNISKPLVIQTAKVEPPRIAFDEIVRGNRPADKIKNEWDLLTKKNSQEVVLNLNQERLHFKSLPTVKALTERKVVLRAMIFDRKEAIQVVENDRQREIETKTWMTTALSPRQQDRILKAQEDHQILDQDWSPPTFEEQMSQVLEKAQKEMAQQNSDSSKVQVSYTDASGQVHFPTERSRPTAAVVPEREKGVIIGGSVLLPDAMGMLPNYHLQVSRFVDGKPRETVPVDLQTGKYRMQAAELSGAVVAQLLDRQGQVLGEGSYRISKYDVAQAQSLPPIQMKRQQHTTSGVLASFRADGLSAAVHGREKGVKAKVLFASFDSEASTDESGSFEFDRVMAGSWSLMRTEAKGHYPALFMTEAGEDKKLPLFSEKMMKALKEIVADQKIMSDVAETGSIVWGQVTQDGKAVAGVQIDVEFLSEYQPVYFNSFLLPDPSLKATGENGYFAILNLPAGFRSLVATRASQYFSHANVVVDDDAISLAEVSASLKKDAVQVKVFDAFSGQAESSHLEIQSLPEPLDVNGFGSLDLPNVSRLSLLQSVPTRPQYLPSVQIYNDRDSQIHVPLVQRAWIESIKANQKISYVPETSTVIGFVPDANHEVYLPHSPEYSREQIVFFNALGEIVPTGVAGGGFILFNVPAGVQSIVVVNSENEMIRSQVVPADVDTNLVLKFSF